MTFETKPMRGTIRMHRLNSRTILVAVSALALASSTCASRTGKTEVGQGPWADQRGGSFKMLRSQCSISGLDHSVETLQTHGEAHRYTGCFTHVKDI